MCKPKLWYIESNIQPEKSEFSFYNNMDGSWEYCAKWDCQANKLQILYDLLTFKTQTNRINLIDINNRLVTKVD